MTTHLRPGAARTGPGAAAARTRPAEPAFRPAVLRDPVGGPASSLLDIQHTAGNRAAGEYLRGATARGIGKTAGPIGAAARGVGGAAVQRDWSDAKSGGATTKTAVTVPPGGNWNAQDIVIGAIRRKTVEGLDSAGDELANKKDDAKEGQEWGGEGRVGGITKEKSIGKALVLLPEPFDKKITTVDVMVYLHGYGIGYRQRVRTRQQSKMVRGRKTSVDEEGMEAGTVRDIEVDRMEQQLDAVNAAAAKGGGRPMIAVMPQGRYTGMLGSQFGATFLSEGYLDKVFGKVAALSGIRRGRAVLAGHSGAGGTLAPMLGRAVGGKGELKSAADQEAAGLPKNLAGVVLFDALNSPGQRSNVESWLTANIRKDMGEMAKLADPQRDDYLANNLVRFRGYYSSSYAAIYKELKANLSASLNSAIAKAAPRAATRGRPATAGMTLTAGQVKALKDNYVDSIQPVPVGHERIMGQGKVQEALSALPIQPTLATGPVQPTPVTGPVQPTPVTGRSPAEQPGRLPSVPHQRLTPEVQQSISRLQRAIPQVQRVDPPGAGTDLAQWTADWSDPQFAGAKRYFNETSRPSGGPEDRYKIMCPLYKARGITRPLQYLANSINPKTTFFGHVTPAHTGMQAMLTAAETALRALKDDKGNPRFTSSPFKQAPWALNVRTTSKNTWSNHADGRAIDLDPDTNPHLDNPEHRAVINELTGFDIEARNPADVPGPAGFGFDIYDAVKMTSDRFSGVYNEAGLTARSAALTTEQSALVAQRNALNVRRDALKAQRQKIAKDRDAAVKLTKIAAERAAIKQQATLAVKDVDKQQEDIKKQLAGKTTEIKSMTKRADRIAAELKKFKREQKAFDATVTSVTAAEALFATATADFTTATALRDAARELVARARMDKKPKAEISALQKDFTAKSAALSKAKTALAKKKKTLKDSTKKRDDYTLRKYAREGILNLPKEVVQALQAAGFRWGGDWAVHKDIMHFDMP